MSKRVRYYKFLGMNGEERIIKYVDDTTFGFVNGRWMSEPSLITKINGRDPDSSVVEITEKEAAKIVGVKGGSKFFYYLSFLVPIIIIIGGVYFGRFAINSYQENKENEKEVYNKTPEERIEEVIKLADNEKDITKTFDKNSIQELYVKIPFSASSSKTAYQKDKNSINTLDTAALFGTVVTMYSKECIDNDGKCDFSVELLKNEVALTYNGYNGYNVLSTPLEFISQDNKYVCTLNDERLVYDCSKYNKMMKSYRDYKIVKVTQDEENLYLYESSVFVKDEYEKDDKFSYSVYRLTNGTLNLATCTLDSGCKELDSAYNTYKGSSVIYKHTYKKDSSGKYYWYTTELHNKL